MVTSVLSYIQNIFILSLKDCADTCECFWKVTGKIWVCLDNMTVKSVCHLMPCGWFLLLFCFVLIYSVKCIHLIIPKEIILLNCLLSTCISFLLDSVSVFMICYFTSIEEILSSSSITAVGTTYTCEKATRLQSWDKIKCRTWWIFLHHVFDLRSRWWGEFTLKKLLILKYHRVFKIMFYAC